jgi:hypothetical protein
VATVLKECITEGQRSVVRFLWAKGLSAKDIHKEMSPINGGKCLLRKAFHNWVANTSLMTKRLKRGAEVAEATVRRLPCSGF